MAATIDSSVQTAAQFDRTGRYRFSLYRRWQAGGKLATFVMFNPSSADHEKNDPTISRCIQLARFWGFSGLSVVNLFAYRTSSPARLRKIVRPIGRENDSHILANAESASHVILGWGNNGYWKGRDQEVISLLGDYDLWCIGKTKSGQPAHPLYAPAQIQLQRFERKANCQPIDEVNALTS